jgi:3-dehydroquinate synthetase
MPGGVPDVERVMELMTQDKKIKQGRLTLILLRAIGESFIERGVDASQIRGFLVQKFSA